jgi:hypothetical protein
VTVIKTLLLIWKLSDSSTLNLGRFIPLIAFDPCASKASRSSQNVVPLCGHPTFSEYVRGSERDSSARLFCRSQSPPEFRCEGLANSHFQFACEFYGQSLSCVQNYVSEFARCPLLFSAERTKSRRDVHFLTSATPQKFLTSNVACGGERGRLPCGRSFRRRDSR